MAVVIEPKSYVKRVSASVAVQTSGSGGKNLFALLEKLARRPDISVERHGSDTEFGH